VPPTLLSRRTTVHPSGDEIAPPPERRVVTAATMMSPGSAIGWAMVSDFERETRAVELPW